MGMRILIPLRLQAARHKLLAEFAFGKYENKSGSKLEACGLQPTKASNV
jgi:hypothetical protein